jgi:hypothetical protein
MIVMVWLSMLKIKLGSQEMETIRNLWQISLAITTYTNAKTVPVAFAGGNTDHG